MTDITALRARQDELMRAEYERQQAANAPQREIAQIEAQIAAAELQQIVDTYNDLASQYALMLIEVKNRLGDMFTALTDKQVDLDLAEATGMEAYDAIERAGGLYDTAERYRGGRGPNWHEYYRRHLADPDIEAASLETHTSREDIAIARANHDDKRPNLPPLPPKPSLEKSCAAWIADGPSLKIRHRRQCLIAAISNTGVIYPGQRS